MTADTTRQRPFNSPNGDRPLPDGGVLVAEIGGWVDRFTRDGRLLYTLRTPTTYPSDAQLLPNGEVLCRRVQSAGPSGHQHAAWPRRVELPPWLWAR